MQKIGSTVIRPMEYDQISIFDEENQLYLVEKGSKQGVINGKGEVVIYADYDQIGYTNETEKQSDTSNEDNLNILLGKCIPVKSGSKYGLYDLDGNEKLEPVYDGLGYEVDSEEDSAEESVLMIPGSVGIKGIVIQLNHQYGIYDVTEGKIVVPCVYTKIYAITKSAKTTYYMEYNEQKIELEAYLEENNMKNVFEEDASEENVSEEDIIKANTNDKNESSNTKVNTTNIN